MKVDSEVFVLTPSGSASATFVTGGSALFMIGA